MTESFTAARKRSALRIRRGLTAISSDEILARREASGLSMRTFIPFMYLFWKASLPDFSLALSFPFSSMLTLSVVLSAM